MLLLPAPSHTMVKPRPKMLVNNRMVCPHPGLGNKPKYQIYLSYIDALRHMENRAVKISRGTYLLFAILDTTHRSSTLLIVVKVFLGCHREY
jgi:hypothetical protein